MKPIENRGIDVGRDAFGNTLITGNGNIVVVSASRELPVPRPAKALKDIAPNPYVGLAAFREEDARRFFGREEQTKSLLARFRLLHKIPSGQEPPLRLLAIHGPSGSGKSSLTRAGLIPELARRPLPGLDKARVASLVPGSHPLEALAAVLARVALNDPAPVAKTREFLGELRRKSEDGKQDGLRRIADALPRIHTARLIVFIDQFEEIYGLCENQEERDIFLANILEAASDRSGHVSVLLTLRSDFLHETQQHPRLNTAISEHGFMVPIMTEAQLRRAICQPAREADHPLEEPLVDLLISQVRGRIGALPLLQFALTRLWNGLSEGISPSETLDRIGGVGGALAGEAQRIYEGLSVDDRAIARRAFLDMVQLGEGTLDTRRRVPIADIVAFGIDSKRVRNVLGSFSQPEARLITLSGTDDGTEAAEVTHEALIEHWTLLRDWLSENRGDIRFQRTLNGAARRWKAQGHLSGSLWRSPDLDLLKAFHERSAEGETPLRLTTVELEFFLASQNAHRRRNAIVAIAIAAIGLLALICAGLLVQQGKILLDLREVNQEWTLRAREFTFHTFLTAWRNGRTRDAEFARSFLTSEERTVAELLVSPDTPAALAAVPQTSASQRAIAFFVMGAHHSRQREIELATAAFRNCRRAIGNMAPDEVTRLHKKLAEHAGLQLALIPAENPAESP